MYGLYSSGSYTELKKACCILFATTYQETSRNLSITSYKRFGPLPYFPQCHDANSSIWSLSYFISFLITTPHSSLDCVCTVFTLNTLNLYASTI